MPKRISEGKKHSFFRKFRDKCIFRLKEKYFSMLGALKAVGYRLQGAEIGATSLRHRLHATWPHQIKIGDNCTLERDVFFKFDGIWCAGPNINIGHRVFIGGGVEFNIRKSIHIGDDCLIASGCRFIDHDHGFGAGDVLMKKQPGVEAAISLGSNVWLGFDVKVLKGVSIGQGSVIAAGSVVTKAVPPCEIWAGVPARKIGDRQ